MVSSGIEFEEKYDWNACIVSCLSAPMTNRFARDRVWLLAEASQHIGRRSRGKEILMNRLLVQLGFLLILLALLTGLAVPYFATPRLGLAAHLAGVMGGLVLFALGALAGKFALGKRAAAVMMWCWVYAAYANWVGSVLGAMTGASRLTPIAGAGRTADPTSEAVVAFLLLSLALAAIVGTALAVWGLRAQQAFPAGGSTGRDSTK